MPINALTLATPVLRENQHLNASTVLQEFETPQLAVASQSGLTIHGASVRARRAAFAVAGVGFVLSSFLAWQVMTDDQILGCSAGSWFSCNEVLRSRFAKVLGIPVSLLGAIIMTVIMACIYLQRTLGPKGRLWRDAVLTTAVASAAGAALWFMGLQIWHIQKGCLYCLTVHACSITIAVLLLRPLIGCRHHARHLLLGIAGVVIMASIQWASPDPPTFHLIEQEPVADINPVAETNEVIDLDLLAPCQRPDEELQFRLVDPRTVEESIGEHQIRRREAIA